MKRKDTTRERGRKDEGEEKNEGRRELERERKNRKKIESAFISNWFWGTFCFSFFFLFFFWIFYSVFTRRIFLWVLGRLSPLSPNWNRNSNWLLSSRRAEFCAIGSCLVGSHLYHPYSRRRRQTGDMGRATIGRDRNQESLSPLSLHSTLSTLIWQKQDSLLGRSPYYNFPHVPYFPIDIDCLPSILLRDSFK